MSQNDPLVLQRLIKALDLPHSAEQLDKRLDAIGMTLGDISDVGGSKYTRVREVAYEVLEDGVPVSRTREISSKNDKGSVVILLYDPKADMVVMVSETRIVTALYGTTPITLECPTGGIARDQTPRQAALKEAHDESGCTIKRMKTVFSNLLVSAGRSDERMYGYVAEVDISKVKEMVAGLKTENERTRVHFIKPKDLFAMANKKESVLIMGTYAMALWFKDNYARLKHEWSSPQIAERRPTQDHPVSLKA